MNSMNNRIPQGLLSALNGAGSVLICGHVNPDGDAVGSCLALAHGLPAAVGRTARRLLRRPHRACLSLRQGADGALVG